MKSEPTGIKMFITKRNDIKDGFDVSLLVHDIEHTTSITGQAGKLTFQMEKDPNGILHIENGMKVLFWHNECEIFSGFIFRIGTDKSQVVQVTAYDNMRYLQNHDFRSISEAEKTLAELFTEICNAMQVDFRVEGIAKTDSKKLHAHNWVDVSLFDILSECMNEMNIIHMAERVYNGNGKYLDEEGKRYDEKFSDKKAISPRFFIHDDFGTLVLDDITHFSIVRKTGIITNKEIEFSNKWQYSKDGSEVADYQPLIIGDRSLLTDYKYEVSIDGNTATEVMIVESGNQKRSNEASSSNVRENWRELIRTAHANDDEIHHAYWLWRNGQYTPGPVTLQEFKKYEQELAQPDGGDKKLPVYPCVSMKHDDEKVAKWGVLRNIRTIGADYTKEQLDEYVRLVAEATENEEKSLHLDALGFDGMIAGSGFFLELKNLGYKKEGDRDTREDFYVENATHHYGEIHTMSLDVRVSDTLPSVI